MAGCCQRRQGCCCPTPCPPVRRLRASMRSCAPVFSAASTRSPSWCWPCAKKEGHTNSDKVSSLGCQCMLCWLRLINPTRHSTNIVQPSAYRLPKRGDSRPECHHLRASRAALRESLTLNLILTRNPIKPCAAYIQDSLQYTQLTASEQAHQMHALLFTVVSCNQLRIEMAGSAYPCTTSFPVRPERALGFQVGLCLVAAAYRARAAALRLQRGGPRHQGRYPGWAKNLSRAQVRAHLSRKRHQIFSRDRRHSSET